MQIFRRCLRTMAKFKVATDLSSKLTLNDGHEIPWFGLGTYKSESGGPAEKAVDFALQNGYRLIDTAQFYENEADVGRGIANSGIRRDQVYVVTKLWQHGHDACIQSFMESLEKLNTGWVDLFLIHSPRGGRNLESYDAMIELQSKGLIKSIGVSNFGIQHLEELRKAGKPTPAVNQIELHPYCRYETLVEYCRTHKIAVMGYSPLARMKFLGDPVVEDIARSQHKQPGHVMIRWSLQSGYITIPKSDKTERILSNANVFDFSLALDDMAQLNSLPTSLVTNNRLDVPWTG